jgi:hypothetical protein
MPDATALLNNGGQKIFGMGDRNRSGVCMSFCATWIKRCYKLGFTLNKASQLGSYKRIAREYGDADLFLAAGNTLTDLPGGYGLTIDRTREASPVTPQWIARELTLGTGGYIFGVYGSSLNVKQGSHSHAAHAMATIREGLTSCFFDPNLGEYLFPNSVKMYNGVAGYVGDNYPELLNLKGYVWKVDT